ncbi:hypothetical protein Tco_1343987 [Tanacetum coccineum]
MVCVIKHISVTNPKEDLKGITTRSGVTIQGPKAVNHDTEVTKDTMPPADNGSTEDVQPPVVQIQSRNPNPDGDDDDDVINGGDDGDVWGAPEIGRKRWPDKWWRRKIYKEDGGENGEQQLQALVNGKKIVVTEASVRRDLQLDDEEGTDCLPNATIFQELTRMGYEKLSQKLTYYKAFFYPQWKFLIHTILQCLSAKTTTWNEFSSTIASAIICLATNQKFNFTKYIFKSMVKNLDNAGKFLMYPRFIQFFLDNQLEGMSSHKRISVTPSHTKKIFANMRRQGKDFFRRETPLFLTMVVQAQEEMGESLAMPTDPHHTPIITKPSPSQPQRKQKSRQPKEKDTQEITSLKKRVKKLEKKGGSRTHKLKRLYKVGRSARIVSSDDVITDKAGKKRTIVEEAVVVSDAVTIPVSAATITNVELTLAQTLAELKSARPKTKGVVMQEPSESTPIISLQLPSQVKGQGSKDKGKAKMIEPEKPLKKKDQIKFDEEEALRL